MFGLLKYLPLFPISVLGTVRCVHRSQPVHRGQGAKPQPARPTCPALGHAVHFARADQGPHLGALRGGVSHAKCAPARASAAGGTHRRAVLRCGAFRGERRPPCVGDMMLVQMAERHTSQNATRQTAATQPTGTRPPVTRHPKIYQIYTKIYQTYQNGQEIAKRVQTDEFSKKGQRQPKMTITPPSLWPIFC